MWWGGCCGGSSVGSLQFCFRDIRLVSESHIGGFVLELGIGWWQRYMFATPPKEKLHRSHKL